MPWRIGAIGVLALLLGTLGGRASPGAAQGTPMGADPAEDLAIVVNRSNPADSLSLVDLRRVFLGGRTHWSNGRRVTVVMRDPGTPERAAILRRVCRMTEQDFRQHFLQLVFTGQVPDVPRQLSTANGVVRFVFNVPGAIGYVRASEVDMSVKVIRVQGRLPGQAGYDLRVGAP